MKNHVYPLSNGVRRKGRNVREQSLKKGLPNFILSNSDFFQSLCIHMIYIKRLGKEIYVNNKKGWQINSLKHWIFGIESIIQFPINRWHCYKMAAKVKLNRLESEIEKCRAERSWLKALEIAKQLAIKQQHLGKHNSLSIYAMSHYFFYIFPQCQGKCHRSYTAWQVTQWRVSVALAVSLHWCAKVNGKLSLTWICIFKLINYTLNRFSNSQNVIWFCMVK